MSKTELYEEVWKRGMKSAGEAIQRKVGWKFDKILPNGNFQFSDRTLPENLILTKQGIKSLLFAIGEKSCFICERCGILFLGVRCPYCGTVPPTWLKSLRKGR